jgi:hypothetical protein
MRSAVKQLLARALVGRQKGHGHSTIELERRHVDPTRPFPNDSSCFYGADAEGRAVVFRLAFRGAGLGPRGRAPESWLDLHLPGLGRFGLAENPGAEGEGFSLGALAFTCVEPGRCWRVTYRGPLTDASGAAHDADLDLLFSSRGPLHDYAQSSDRSLIASAIARERWDGAFFRALADLEQVHYEQYGRLRGRVTLDGRSLELDLRSVRDHSFGSRDWSTWDRHYWIAGVTEAGVGFTAVAIRYDFCGPLYAGFVVDPEGRSDAIVACTSLDEVAGEDVWPDHGALLLTMRSGRQHRVEFRREGVFPYLMDGVYLMKEGIGAYRFDGAPAVGLCEFGFKKERYGHRLPG